MHYVGNESCQHKKYNLVINASRDIEVGEGHSFSQNQLPHVVRANENVGDRGGL